MRYLYYDKDELNTEPEENSGEEDSFYDDEPVSVDDHSSEDNRDVSGDDIEASGDDREYEAEHDPWTSREKEAALRKYRARKVRKQKTGLIVLACIAGALIAVYAAGCRYFSDHFTFHTTLNGSDVSLMTEDQVADMLSDAASGYTLTITGRNGVTDTITGSEISLKPAYGDAIASLITSQNRMAWPASLWTRTDLTSDATAEWDAAQLSDVIDHLAFFDSSNETAPTDAGYELSSTGYVIVPENDGAMPVKEAVTQVIESALNSFASSVTLDDSCYEKAAVRSDDENLVSAVTELNTLAGMTVTIPFGEETETLDGSTLGTWIVGSDGTSISTDSSSADSLPSELSFDQTKISDYVDSLADKYDTYGKDRTFRTTDGETITVSGGAYGWLMDRDATETALSEFLAAGESGEFNVTWTQEAAQHGEDDIGDSYCEVDLDDQHVWIYVDGSCVVSTDCVSGKAIDPNRLTPDGTYAIYYRKSPATLRGEGYESPVTYWMPFNRGIGFHDATWRSSFGGEIYLTNGSHGCINLPLDAAKEVYANVYSGMPVVVYGGMTAEEAQEYTGQHPEVAAQSAQTEDSSVTESDGSEADQQAAEQAVIQQAIQNYEALGMSEAEAAAKVQQDLASQLADQQAAAAAAQQAAEQAAQNAAAAQQAAADAAAAASGQ